MKKLLALATVLVASVLSMQAEKKYHNSIRPPATPLITVDPYFSVWTMNDELTGDVTRHWTGWKQPILGAVRVDGRTYRVIGSELANPDSWQGNYKSKRPRRDQDVWYDVQTPALFPVAARQVDSDVQATRSIYTFQCSGVEIQICFTAPVLLDDIDLLSRPVNYLTWTARSIDGRRHQTDLYLEVSPRIAIDLNVVPMVFEAGSECGISYLRTGTVQQSVLEKRGDDVRIDWGYFYLGVPDGSGKLAIARSAAARTDFLSRGCLDTVAGASLESDNFVQDDLALCYSGSLGKVGSKPVSEYVMLGYDDISSIKYQKTDTLKAWWNRDGSSSVPAEMARASADYSSIVSRCEEFDARLAADAIEAGGNEYADLLALAYRQAVTAHKLVVSKKGELFFISKENFSNGCAGTVDVTYPSMPLFLIYNNKVAQSLLNHIFDYCEGPGWKRNWAAHDIGVYPDAYGQHYGNWMPLEECGNMLLLTAATVLNGNDLEYASRHWMSLTRWALYCVEHGQNPENQLCTDDFAGKLAHNANLSAKSILGIAAYAKMAELLGKEAESEAFFLKAREMAGIWKKTAAQGDHYKLAFDADSTWSMKYNLVWDRILGLNVFDEDIVPTELDWYKSHSNVYGVPLDSRKEYTKTDWVLWVAAMTPDYDSFRGFVLPIWKFYNETVDRVPLADWTDTDAPTYRNMHARSVVGGFWMRFLAEEFAKKSSFKNILRQN